MKTIFYLTLLFFVFPRLSSAQHWLSIGIKADIGLSGLAGTEEIPPVLEETTIAYYIPNFSSALGLTGEYYFGKKRNLGLSIGLLSNFASYTRHENLKFQNLITGLAGGEAHSTKTFRLIDLLVPVKFNYRFKKVSFSAGIINTWHLFAEGERNTRFREFNPNTPWDNFNPRSFSTKKVKKEEGVFPENTVFERRFTPQITFGVAYEISNVLNIGLEFSNYLRANHIQHTFLSFDTIVVNHHEFKYSKLALSLTWWLERY